MKIIDFIIKQHPVWITFGYIGLLTGVFYKHSSAGQSLSLNELGDFLAGVFAPLAFYWLVLGFFQQSKELKNSVDALNLQAKELRNSVKAQQKQAENAERSLSHQLETEQSRRVETALKNTPRFTVLDFVENKDESGAEYLTISLVNSSATAHYVTVSSFSKMHPVLRSGLGKRNPGYPIDRIENDTEIQIDVFRPHAGGPLIINGKTINGIEFEQQFSIYSSTDGVFKPEEISFTY